MFDHFDQLAPIYERLIPPPDAKVLRGLLELKPEHVLLDAAGGTGRVAGLFVASIAHAIVCDTSSRMLDLARNKGFETIQAEVENLPFADATFDRILLVDAFHHVRDQPAALRELLRVLKPSGRLVIEEPDVRHLIVKVVALLEKLFLMRSHFKSPATVLKMIIKAGGNPLLARVDCFRVWIVVLKK